MRTMTGLGALFLLTAAITATPAGAHDVATRCDGRNCSVIVCNRTGDRCRRFDSDRRDWYERRPWRDESWRGDGDWRYRRGGWRRNCDPENPTCLQPLDGRFAE